MFLIVGLGNPGSEYALTRHNVGFMAVDVLADRARFSSKFQGLVAQHSIEGEACLLLKPQTFMNLSGKSVQAAAAFYKIPPKNIIVLHDELDLPLGKWPQRYRPATRRKLLAHPSRHRPSGHERASA